MLRDSVILFNVIFSKCATVLSFVAGLILLTSCSSEVQENQEKSFYDVRVFIETQAASLNAMKPKVVKTTQMAEEKNEVVTSAIDWTKELELFAQADINKPSYKQSYAVSRPDSTTYIYTSKEGNRLPVRTLKIVVNELNQPISIEAVIKTENKLYSSEKNIALNCESIANVPHIRSYRISGFQKLVMMDQKPFRVDAKIEY